MLRKQHTLLTGTVVIN